MIPKVQKPEIHQKTWGKEIWITNNDKYCGKILEFKKDHHSSLHYHTKKTETWYVLNGTLILENPNSKPLPLHPGDVVHLEPLTQHKLVAVENSTIIEVSTPHHETDTTRILPSGKI